MSWLTPLAHLFGGAFLTNAVPHLVSGLTGRAFQTPFADPPGRGLSSPVVNVLWGAANSVVGYLLIWQVGGFDPRRAADIGPAALGALLIALFSAYHFGRVNGERASGADR